MSLPILTVAQMREWEQATWAAGQTQAEVISRVGLALARRILGLTLENNSVLLLAGKGHNGDDARAALPHLKNRNCECLDVTSPSTQLPQLRAALAKKPALIVDGLFGIGLNRPLDAGWIEFVSTLNASRARVLAVDVPSGLDADSGNALGAAVQASITLTVGAPKTGLLKTVAGAFTGRLEVAADVGLVPCPIATEIKWICASDFGSLPLRRNVGAHKGDFGHLQIVAGSLGYHGAAVIATRAAQRAQPGKVTLHTHDEAFHPVASQLQSAMVGPWREDLTFAPTHCTAALIGPGLAARGLPDEMHIFTRKAWRDPEFAVIVDASALDWLLLGTVPKNVIRVLTPHPGEAARLIKCTPQQVQADRPRAVREISSRFGNCWVVLKGHHTLIGRSEGGILVNSTGNPHLAQGGSGDALSGFIAGLLAQPQWQADPAGALAYAVWQHGAVADALQSRRTNWMVEDLVEEIGNVQPECG
jgi:NAD(P)H-hydrate epimerase